MRYGTVVKYSTAEGVGVIRPDVGPDVVFHSTALGACRSQPRIEPGQSVKYEIEPGPEPEFQSQPRRSDEGATRPEQAAHPQAWLVAR